MGAHPKPMHRFAAGKFKHLSSVSGSGLMRAAVLHPNSSSLKIEKLRIPQPKANEVLIRNHSCGVCHTDLHVLKNEVPFPKPCVLGHEVSGEIVDFGPNTDPVVKKRLKIGQKVVSTFIMPCGSCYHCDQGHDDLCETFFEYNRGKGTLYDGTTRLYTPQSQPISMYSMGGLAEYCVSPWTGVYPLPPSVDHTDACVLGCAIFTAYGAVKNAGNVQAGESVAVIGAGGVGANCLQIARAFGATTIIAIDISDDKLSTMPALGATHIINALQENVEARIREITGGRGVDVAIEALGKPQTFSQTVAAVRDGGRAVMVGIAPVGEMASVEITRIVRRQIRIIGSYGARARTDMPAILRLVSAGLIDVSRSITRRYSLDDADEAYRALDQGQITGRAIIEIN
eukprot:TRINITY_DN6328_c0_g2_i4.p1 TRINITY_DN6328_c0_g2~~TRINITY_DN6328_c0_g2_i4.p1  ORF type:complete len:409 (-),score=63.67 TRINITY_DN6328_c0_g2_i4:46-1242(-)